MPGKITQPSEGKHRLSRDPIRCALCIVFVAMWIVVTLMFFRDWISGERTSVLLALIGSTMAFLATLRWAGGSVG